MLQRRNLIRQLQNYSLVGEIRKKLTESRRQAHGLHHGEVHKCILFREIFSGLSINIGVTIGVWSVSASLDMHLNLRSKLLLKSRIHS